MKYIPVGVDITKCVLCQRQDYWPYCLISLALTITVKEIGGNIDGNWSVFGLSIRQPAGVAI